MLALTGELYYIDSQQTREMRPDPPFVLSPIIRDPRSVEQALSRLAPSDLLFHWQAAQTTAAGTALLASANLPPSGGGDLMILLRQARTQGPDNSAKIETDLIPPAVTSRAPTYYRQAKSKAGTAFASTPWRRAGFGNAPSAENNR